jgi:hypothetical protein
MVSRGLECSQEWAQNRKRRGFAETFPLVKGLEFPLIDKNLFISRKKRS